MTAYAERENCVRLALKLPMVLACAGSLAACGSATQPQSIQASDTQKALVGVFDPKVAAQQNYEKSLAEYQNCIAANPSNANACENQKRMMEAAVKVLADSLKSPGN